MSEHMALENLTVLDLTRVLAGPFCTMMLADMGANVIKIEVPKGGDDTRSYPPFRAENLNGERESVYFANINRNKKGITLNLKAPEGKEIFKELVKKADIVVENYRPGVMDKLGLGYDVLKEINPRIIYAAVSGFGCYGPYHLRPGYDILAQAMGGMMSITGSKGGEPTRAGSALGDILGGLHVTIGILAAVNARTITGKGQRVDVSLMDSMIAATENTALKYIETGNITAHGQPLCCRFPLRQLHLQGRQGHHCCRQPEAVREALQRGVGTPRYDHRSPVRGYAGPSGQSGCHCRGH